MTIQLTVAYDGTSFHGWQAQPDQRTVQGTLAAALARLVGRPVDVQGASRTDQGVHALGQVASVAGTLPIPTDRLLRALNGLLPPDVRIRAVQDVDDTFHARHSAVGKRYRYLLDRRPVADVFLGRRALHAPGSFDLPAARAAAGHLTGEHDFAAFGCVTGEDRESVVTVRTVHSISIEETDGVLRVDVWGRSFLYKMVRTLVGTLVEVGRGRWEPDRVREALDSRDRRRAGPTLPPHGLCLETVFYDPDVLRVEVVNSFRDGAF